MRKFVTLQFLAAGLDYTPALIKTIAAGVHQTCYTKMLEFPEDEMLTYTPEGIANELYTHSTSLAWHSKLRRAIKPGDIFTFQGHTWVFIPADDFTPIPNRRVTTVGGWTNLHLKILCADITADLGALKL